MATPAVVRRPIDEGVATYQSAPSEPVVMPPIVSVCGTGNDVTTPSAVMRRTLASAWDDRNHTAASGPAASATARRSIRG